MHYAPILPHMLPPIIVLLTACLTLMYGVFFKRTNVLAGIAMAGLVMALLLVWRQGGSVLLCHGQYAVDHLTRVLHTMILSSMLFVIFFSHVSSYDEPHSAEYYTLMLCSTLGMMILSGAEHLLVMFVGMELMSLPIVTLVALPGKTRHIEGALKYFITGGVASCLLLFGCSLIYGATSVLGYSEIAMITETLGGSTMLAYACVFLFSGVAFKLGTAPFHMWVPDVYEGANTPTTMILATAAKVAAVGMMIRLFSHALPSIMPLWQPMVLVVAILSIILGNLIAVVQHNIRRLLAYSSIAHMGYLLLGIYVGTESGLSAVIFYLSTYVITSVVAFSSLMVVVHRQGEIEGIKELSGLNTVYPWQAFTLLLSCFSLAGVPPLLGFMGKLAIFKSLVDSHHQIVAAMAIIFAVVGAYYYIRVIQIMYFDQPEEGSLILTSGRIANVLLIGSGLSLLVLGLFPNSLFLAF